MINIPTSEVLFSKTLIREIDQSTVDDLKTSIQQYGIMQPIVVFINEEKNYEVIFGNHRLKAAKSLMLPKIPVIIRNVSRSEAKILSIVENIQRHPMNPVREGEIYFELINKEQKTMEIIAQQIGKSKHYVEDRILIHSNLHPKLRKEIGNTLSFTNASTLARLPLSEQQQRFKRMQDNLTNKQSNKKEKVLQPQTQSNVCTCPLCGAKHLKGVSISE